VVDLGLGTASDIQIVERAEADGYVIVPADTDFPMLVALRRATSPSIVLLRGVTELAPDGCSTAAGRESSPVSDDLDSGALVSLGPDHLRARGLPLS